MATDAGRETGMTMTEQEKAEFERLAEKFRHAADEVERAFAADEAAHRALKEAEQRSVEARDAYYAAVQKFALRPA